MARAGRGRSAAALAVLCLSALALALAGGALASEPYAAAGECTPLKQRACKKSPLCKWGGRGVRCAVAKDACDAVQGRKMRKKCGRVSTMRCQCSLNPGKKRGKCGACAESLVGAPSPAPTPTAAPTPTPAPPLTSPGAKNWRAITSSSDGTKLAAAVEKGNIWTSTDSGKLWTERSVDGTKKDWQAIASSSDGTKLVAVGYDGIWTSTDSGQTWTERSVGARLVGFQGWWGIASSSDGTKLAAVVMGGTIWTSTDSGQSWTERLRRDRYSWRGIASSSDGTKLAAVVMGGTIWTSTDSGQSWTERLGSAPMAFLEVALSSDGRKFAAAPLGCAPGCAPWSTAGKTTAVLCPIARDSTPICTREGRCCCPVQGILPCAE